MTDLGVSRVALSPKSISAGGAASRELSFADLKALSDEQVMTHLKDGSDDALAVLFDRYQRLVMSIGLKILRDLGEAEDVTQAVFLEIYRVVAQFDASKGSTKVWLLQYAYHRSMNRRQYLKTHGFYDQSTISDLCATETRTRCGNSGALALPEVRRLISEGLSTLNKEQHRTLRLAYFGGLTLREIALQTGESLANIRHHYYRGIDRLRSHVLKTKANAKVESVKVRDVAWNTNTSSNSAR